MRRRLLAAAAALLLIAAGTVVLVGYVRGAEHRALAGVQTVHVLVAETVIPAGTPGSALAGMVRTQLLPAKAALPGRVTDLPALADRVTTVDLAAGEQLLESRFVRPEDRRSPGTVPVPEGLQEVSVVLEPQRAVGGRLAAGDTVGVLVSMGGDAGGTTHAVLHGVLVTQVQGAPAPPGDGAVPAAAPAPSGSLVITFAVTAAQAEAVVFAAEHASIWLTLEPEDPDVSRTEVLTPDTIYGKAYS